MGSCNRITRIVCSGGGAKGVVYPAAFKALKKTGAFKNIEHLSGASAGAITSSFMAFGMDDKMFRKKLLDTNFKSLIGSKVKNKTDGCCFLTKDGSNMLEFIIKSIIESLIGTPKGSKPYIIGTLEKIPQDIIDKLVEKDKSDLFKLKEKLKLNQEKITITFADLGLLNKIDPKQFKKLTITAVTYPNGELQVFDCESTPNVEVALAARASASIPVVLEPVEIKVNGQVKRFIDGGMFDNLPTDYFDKDSNDNYIPNNQTQQTLVFAFGEGLDDKNNPVYQSLYGERWDEIITRTVLDNILQDAINQSIQIINTSNRLLNAEQTALLIYKSSEQQINKLVKKKHITKSESKVLLTTLKGALSELLLSTKKNQKFWFEFNFSENLDEKKELFLSLFKDKLTPVLYDAGFSERLKRNTLTKHLARLNLPYNNTEQKNAGYHKLKSEYPLRTVELRVGDIKTTDFDKAKKVARTMDSLGYIDTINYVINHNIYDENFNPENFYHDTVDNFINIYTAVLQGAGKDTNKDRLLNKIYAITNNPKRCNLEATYLIKDYVEKNVGSNAAFALSRAVELNNGDLTSDQLFKETYIQAFKQSSWFSLSKITGKSYFFTSSLETALDSKNMFSIHKSRMKDEQKESRAKTVFNSLKKITQVEESFDNYDNTNTQGSNLKM